jgi:hypothetical protein
MKKTNQQYVRTGRSLHPLYSHFKNMKRRERDFGIECDFPYGQDGVDRWLKAIGQVPEGMKKPSIGRYDHSKGYVFDTEMNRWNFRWQEMPDNLDEMLRTRGGFVTMLQEKRSEVAALGGKVGGPKAVKLQMAAGLHPSQTGKAGFQTGVAQRVSAKGPNHVSRQSRTCQGCGRTSVGAKWKYHCDNLICQKDGYSYRDRRKDK